MDANADILDAGISLHKSLLKQRKGSRPAHHVSPTNPQIQ